MKTKAIVLFSVLCFALSILSPKAFAATAHKKPDIKWTRHISEDWNVDGAGWESHIPPTKVYQKYLSGGAKLNCEDVWPEVGTIIQHDQIGDTWYDFQKNGSVGRMISVTNEGYRHFSWMYTDHQYPPGPRYVDATCKDPLGNFIDQVHADGGDVNAGYCNQTHLHDGTSVIVHHRTAGSPVWSSVLTIDDSLCSGSFSKHWDIPDYIEFNTSGENGMWPKADVLYCVDTTVYPTALDYVHVVFTEGNTNPEPVMIGYERCFISPTNDDTLYCESHISSGRVIYPLNVNQAGGGSFTPVGRIDTSQSVTPLVTVSPVSSKVAIGYLWPTCDGSGDYLEDLCYYESMNNGNEWLDSGFPPRNNVTDFGCTGTERCWHDLAITYDYEDSLHIVYLTCGFDPELPGYYQPGVGRIYHWSKKDGISYIHEKLQGGTDPGVHNCILAKMSFAAQDPIYHPGGDSVYLYTIWTQFDSSDNSASDFSNGDIMGSGSFDGGATWGGIFNLTNTQTPGCTPGNCVSEHWSSLSQNMYDGDLHIQYICDRDAGGAIQDGTQWMSNPVMYLHLTDWNIMGCLGWRYTIREPTHLYHPPLKVPIGGTRDLVLWIYNRHGCPVLNFNVSSDHPCIQINEVGVIPPGDSVIVTGFLDGSGDCVGSFIDGNIIISANYDKTWPIYEPVQAIVADDYYECPRNPETVDTLYNGVLLLSANANCGESISDSATMADTALDIFFEGGTIIATTSGTDTIVGRYMREDRNAGARDKLYTEECDVDWEPDFWLVYTKNVFMQDFEPPADYKWYWWELSKQIKFFKETAPEVYKHLVIKYVKVRRHGPPGWWPDQSPFTGYEDTYVGVVEDIDCPWDSSQGEPYVSLEENCTNEGGYDPVNHIAWQRGFGSGEHPQYNNYYCGTALADADGSGDIVPYGSYCVKNNHYVYPQGGWGWKDGQLYWLVSQSGSNIEDPDSLVDRSTVLTAAKIDAGDDLNAEASFTVILAVAPNGLAELQSYVDSARTIVAREAQFGHGIPVICADINGDGEVEAGDIVYWISWVFKDGLPPPCPLARADVNGNGEIDAGDVVSMINYLFRGYPYEFVFSCPGIWGPDRK
jgi:hypothetical protein